MTICLDGKGPPQKSRCCGGRACAFLAALVAALCGSAFRALPSPTDAEGRHVLSTGVLLEFYAGLFCHVMGMGHTQSAPAPRLSADVLAAAPAQWTLSPLPELYAGVDFTTREELMHVFAPYANDHPVIIRNFLSHPNATKSWAGGFRKLTEPWWDTKYLQQALAGVEIRVFENYSTDDSIAWWDFRDYADEVINNASSIAYARAITEHWEVREHMVDAFDFDLYDSLSGRPWPWRDFLHKFHEVVGPIALFVSGKVPTTRLHADAGESFVIHTEGQKRWRFFQPEMAPLLRPTAMVKTVGFEAGMNIWAPDFEAEPQLRLLRGFETVTEPGDLIYFPSQTWHGVENVGDRNVMFDVARLDVPRGFRRNWPQSLATALHPGGGVNLFRFCVMNAPSRDGHRLPAKYSCGKEVFFQNFATKARKS